MHVRIAGLVSVLALVVGQWGCAGEDTSEPGGAPTGSAESNATAACTNLPSGPFTPATLGRVFAGSEDFAFDGQGNIVGKRGDAIARVSRTGSTTFATLPGQTFGLRYRPNGELVAAIPGAGKLVVVTPGGTVEDLLTGLGGPNGVYVDAESNVWFTEFGGNAVGRLTPDGQRTTIASGTANAQAANGVVVDEKNKRLFYTEFGKGRLHRVDLGKEPAEPVLVAEVPGARLDGLVLDACGNVYVVDQGGSRLFRVKVDAKGNSAAQPELLATFPVNVANAQFGSGEGFDKNTLFVAGNPGTVFAVPVGVAGAPVPTSPALGPEIDPPAPTP